MSLPKPYYQDDAVTIYNMDCRDYLAQNMLGGGMPDLLVTDPPYGMNFQSNHRIEKHQKISGDDSLDFETIKRLIASVSRAAYVFCRWDNLFEMPKPKSVLAWVKNNWSMGDLLHEHGRQWEACCFYPLAGHEFKKRIPDVIHANRTGNDLHPTEKPVTLIAQIIEANIGDVVFDPYMGSGTTLRAAKDLGRKAIGIELNERYCEIAARRMCQEVLAL